MEPVLRRVEQTLLVGKLTNDEKTKWYVTFITQQTNVIGT